MYRFNEDDENRLVKIARSIDIPVKVFLVTQEIDSFSFKDRLEYTREIQEDLPKNNNIETLPEGNKLFRNYQALKNRSSLTVIFAEAGIAAEKHGLELKIIAPEDTKTTQTAVEQLPAYLEYRNEKNKEQQQAIESLKRLRIPQESYDDLMKGLTKRMVTQTPFAEISPDKYLCFVRHSNSLENKFILFTKENKFLIDESLFYHPEFGKGPDYFEEAMK